MRSSPEFLKMPISYFLVQEIIMTGSWTLDVFIIGSIVLIGYPSLVCIAKHRKKERKRHDQLDNIYNREHSPH